jgi:hypothetical protein
MHAFIRSIVLASVLAFVAAGCAPLQVRGKQQQKDCDDRGPCVITVSVSNIGTVVEVNYDVVVVRKKSKIDITWEIDKDSSGYHFRQGDGVVVDAPTGAFDCKNDGEKFKCKDNHVNTEVTVYKYSIHLVGTFTSPSYDPWIVND